MQPVSAQLLFALRQWFDLRRHPLFDALNGSVEGPQTAMRYTVPWYGMVEPGEGLSWLPRAGLPFT